MSMREKLDVVVVFGISGVACNASSSASVKFSTSLTIPPGPEEMTANTARPLPYPHQQGHEVTLRKHDLNNVFNQAKIYQDLLHFEHDAHDTNPAVVTIQEYARAVRLLDVKTRWTKLGLSDWHLEMQILLYARESVFMGLSIWEPLDDFLDTYVFEMEIQPLPETDAKSRKLIKQGLLRQLLEVAKRRLDRCHNDLCDMFGDELSDWRVLEIRLATMKKQIWADCERRGSLSIRMIGEAARPDEKCATTLVTREGGTARLQGNIEGGRRKHCV
jgi:hypothetical protein